MTESESQGPAKPVLNVHPATSTFKATGGINKHEIINETDKRHAFKVKCSNNDAYRVSIVYGFVAANGKVSLNVHRLPEKQTSGQDRFVVQWAEVPEEETNPKAPFVAQCQSGEVVFTVEEEK